MDLDNIYDVDVLKSELRKTKVRALRNFAGDLGYIFKEGHYYNVSQDCDAVTVYNDDYSDQRSFDYNVAHVFLYTP